MSFIRNFVSATTAPVDYRLGFPVSALDNRSAAETSMNMDVNYSVI